MKYRFDTSRLLVDDWHSFSRDECNETDLALIVLQVLTPKVTQSLPPAWQGSYSRERAGAWIEERASEGETLLVVEKSTRSPVGLMIYFLDDKPDIHLGYMLAESAWGKGFATELLSGFVKWGESAGINTVFAGVANENAASIRVLEKTGFQLVRKAENDGQCMYTKSFVSDSG